MGEDFPYVRSGRHAGAAWRRTCVVVASGEERRRYRTSTLNRTPDASVRVTQTVACKRKERKKLVDCLLVANHVPIASV